MIQLGSVSGWFRRWILSKWCFKRNPLRWRCRRFSPGWCSDGELSVLLSAFWWPRCRRPRCLCRRPLDDEPFALSSLTTSTDDCTDGGGGPAGADGAIGMAFGFFTPPIASSYVGKPSLCWPVLVAPSVDTNPAFVKFNGVEPCTSIVYTDGRFTWPAHKNSTWKKKSELISTTI